MTVRANKDLKTDLPYIMSEQRRNSLIRRRLREVLFVPLFFLFFIIIKIITLYYTNRKKPRLSSNGKPRVLYLACFFPTDAGYQWRVNKWAELLTKDGFQVEIRHSFSREEFIRLRESNSILRFQLINLYSKLKHLLESRKFDVVIVRRTILLYNEYGDLFYEKLLLAIHPNAILDFDDDMQRENPDSRVSLYGKLLMENKKKFYESLGFYRFFIVGSPFLERLVKTINPTINSKNTALIPTCIDYAPNLVKNYKKKMTPLIVGWIGSNGNQHYLEKLIDPLNKINKQTPIELLVISGEPYDNEKAAFPIKNLAWSLETEVESMMKIDIGVMPLFDSEMERGKCGFKLLQYMGLGIVSVADDVGINKLIINDSENGYLASKTEDWSNVLTKIVKNTSEFPQIGSNAKETVSDKYSFESNKQTYSSFVKYVSNQ